MRADARENRQDVLDAAWRLFATEGPDVSLRAVAKEAEVGIATLYRHFPTRDDLVLGVVDHMQSQVKRIIEDHDEEWGIDAERAWSATVRGIADLRLGALVYQMAPIADSSETVARGAEQRRERALASFGPVLDRAKSSGLLRRDVPVDRFFLGLATLTRPLPQEADAVMPAQHEWLVSAYLRGLRP